MSATTPDGVTNPPKVGTGSDCMHDPVSLKQKQRWMLERHSSPTPVAVAVAFSQRHFTPNELAKIWGMHPSTIRRIFSKIPGVLKLHSGEAGKCYSTLRIPASVAAAWHEEHSR